MIDIIRDVEDIYNDFGNTLVNVEKPFALSTEATPILGSCSKSNNTYSVVTPTTNDDKLNFLVKLHEYGHIKCGHLEGIHEDMDSSLKKIILNKDEALVNAINEKCGIDYASDILDKVISDPVLNHVIHNMSMDMEVNSTILDKDDIDSMTEGMNQLIYEEYMKISDNGTKNVSMQALNNLYAKFDMKFIHPSTFGFETGLTYPDYLVQCILNLDKVLNELSNNYNNSNKAQDRLDQQDQKNQQDQGQGQSQTQQGESQDNQEGNNRQGQPSENERGESGSQDQQNQSGQTQSNEDSSNSQGGSENQDPRSNPNMPKTREEFDQMMENMRNSNSNNQGQNQSSNNSDGESMPPMNGGSSGNQSSSTSQNGQGQQNQSDQNDYSNDHGTDSRNQADDKRQDNPNNYANNPSNGIGNDHSDYVRNYQVNNDPLEMHLQEIIRECRHKVIKRDFAKDMVHKYNRKILGKDNKMLSPTYKQKITKSENPTVAFVIDVSGSMDESLIDRCITTIRNQMKRLDRSLKYNIIAWDTQLCEYYKDIDFRSPIPKLHSCGGTRMAGSFDLFKKDFSNEAIMILISDFEDDLSSWHNKEKSMNGYSMYGLCYGSRPRSVPDFKNFKVRYCSENTRSW